MNSPTQRTQSDTVDWSNRWATSMAALSARRCAVRWRRPDIRRKFLRERPKYCGPRYLPSFRTAGGWWPKFCKERKIIVWHCEYFYLGYFHLLCIVSLWPDESDIDSRLSHAIPMESHHPRHIHEWQLCRSWRFCPPSCNTAAELCASRGVPVESGFDMFCNFKFKKYQINQQFNRKQF